MSDLENLIAEFYDWSGYLVKRNLKVRRLKHGGWEMELDIIAFHPQTKHLVHLQPSIDAHLWTARESRFKKKFVAGEKYLFDSVFPWLDKEPPWRESPSWLAILLDEMNFVARRFSRSTS